MNRHVTVAALLASIILACAGPAVSPSLSAPSPTGPVPSVTPSPSSGPATPLTLMTHDAFALSDPVIQSFESANDVDLKVLKSGDAGAMVNQAILSKGHPLADVLYGVDNTFLSRALDAGIFQPWVSTELADVPTQFQTDPTHQVTPVDYGDVCINTDKSAFAAGSPPAPQTLDDLIKPAYKDMLVVENPATSSPGLAFLLATIIRYGDTGTTTWRDYWAALKANGVLVSDSWDDAYDTQFSGGSGKGSRSLVVSYASSPAAEVYYAAPQPSESPVGTMFDGCFRQIEYAGVLAGASQPALAGQWVDFMLSKQVQEDIPLQMFVYPVRTDAQLPPVFQQFAEVAPAPLTMPYDVIGQNRDQWIAQWTDIVLP